MVSLLAAHHAIFTQDTKFDQCALRRVGTVVRGLLVKTTRAINIRIFVVLIDIWMWFDIFLKAKCLYTHG